MKRVKKMAFGGSANLPVQAQAAMANPAATGVDRPMPGPAPVPPTPQTMAPAPAIAAMPAQGNAGGAMRGLDRAAAMSGRTMPTPGAGRPVGMKKGGAVKSSASSRGDGCAQRGKTKGRMV